MSDIDEFKIAQAGAAASESEAHTPSGDAYTDEEVAAIVARLSSFGIPIPLQETYVHHYIQHSKPAMELLGMGEALDELGINKSGGAAAVPAWVRAGGGAAILAFTAVSVRKQIATNFYVDTSGGGGNSSTETERDDTEH